jgi:hypothetical protein
LTVNKLDQGESARATVGEPNIQANENAARGNAHFPFISSSTSDFSKSQFGGECNKRATDRLEHFPVVAPGLREMADTNPDPLAEGHIATLRNLGKVLDIPRAVVACRWRPVLCRWEKFPFIFLRCFLQG